MDHSTPVQGPYTHGRCLSRYSLVTPPQHSHAFGVHPRAWADGDGASAGLREQMAGQMQCWVWPWASRKAKHHRDTAETLLFLSTAESHLCFDSLWLFYLDEPYGAIMPLSVRCYHYSQCSLSPAMYSDKGRFKSLRLATLTKEIQRKIWVIRFNSVLWEKRVSEL